MRYHPLYDGLWADERLGSFETRAFFAFLCTHDRQRPSGIYRATDQQLALDTRLPLRRVRDHLARLEQAGRIVRDPPWIFVKGYLKRQSHNERLLSAVRLDLRECTSATILEAFGKKYPLLDRWSRDRLETVKRPSLDRQETVSGFQTTPVGVACPTDSVLGSVPVNQPFCSVLDRPETVQEPAAALPDGAPPQEEPVGKNDQNGQDHPGPLAAPIAEFMATIRAAAAVPLEPRPRRRDLEAI